MREPAFGDQPSRAWRVVYQGEKRGALEDELECAGRGIGFPGTYQGDTMKKKSLKKLVLAKETLNDLSKSSLAGVVAGEMGDSGLWYCFGTWAGCSGARC